MKLLFPVLLLVASAAGADEEPSKKERFLAEKSDRTDVHATRKPAPQAESVLTLHNVWTDESLPVLASERLDPARFDQLVRCHFTNQSANMDPRLGEVIRRAAQRFKARYIEIVSGFRAPKYQLMLRKKGHEVARDSQHPLGHAVDFRIPEVPTKVLLRFVRSLRLGGVGYYPESRFVHCDVGRVRFWRGR
jgi:uncharacterized protein YcbK (DUF882 family)